MARPKKTPEIVLSADEAIYVTGATTMLVAAARSQMPHNKLVGDFLHLLQ